MQDLQLPAQDPSRNAASVYTTASIPLHLTLYMYSMMQEMSKNILLRATLRACLSSAITLCTSGCDRKSLQTCPGMPLKPATTAVANPQITPHMLCADSAPQTSPLYTGIRKQHRTAAPLF